MRDHPRLRAAPREIEHTNRTDSAIMIAGITLLLVASLLLGGLVVVGEVREEGLLARVRMLED